ncbi:hypothetical protein EYF80_003252 [Liparis tanakae]|uniref:Uncharacterized protein n=1 Tax=Liparis tanakae TaxID=230148 RepID=A0A4Z2JAQ8_9TELE|nr:hypothetical protein EYF80_003252 [Liparis tanakae]
MVVSLPGVAGALPERDGVQPRPSSRPGVWGTSWYDGYEAGGSEEARLTSVPVGEMEKTSSAESSLSSSVTIPFPGVCGRSASSAGDVGLLLIRRSGSLSRRQPVGVTGLRFSMFPNDSSVQSGLSISTSRLRSEWDESSKLPENESEESKVITITIIIIIIIITIIITITISLHQSSKALKAVPSIIRRVMSFLTIDFSSSMMTSITLSIVTL